jgi:hypothetical protein
MTIRSVGILTLLLALAMQAFAQKKKSRKKATNRVERNVAKKPAADTLKGTTIEVIQSYKPEIRQAAKPTLPASLPPADTAKPVFNYEVPRQSLNYNYKSQPIRPLALERTTRAESFVNYLKLGGGNLSTLLVDAGIGGLQGEQYETAFHLRHLTQTGNVKYQNITSSGIDAEGKLHANSNLWRAAAAVSRDQYHYYGYDHNLFTYGVDSLKQAFTGVKLSIDMKNEDVLPVLGVEGINYHPALKLSLYNDRFNSSERSLQLSVPISYDVDTSLQVKFGVHTFLTETKFSKVAVSNNILQFAPAVSFHRNAFRVNFGLYPTLGKTGFFFLPDVEAMYLIGKFRVNAGWKSVLNQNNYEQLSTTNPYMINIFLVQQTRKDKLFGGVKGNIGSHISFGGQIGWTQYKDMPMFINDTTTTDAKQFLVVYDKVRALSFEAFARYQVADMLSVGLSSIWYNYTAATFAHVWHEPSVSFKGDVMVRVLPQLTVIAYLSVLDGIYGLKKGNIPVRLGANFDLGAAAEYNFMPRLSAFLTVNNILNNRYQRWLGYQSFGMNVYGGIRFKF